MFTKGNLQKLFASAIVLPLAAALITGTPNQAYAGDQKPATQISAPQEVKKADYDIVNRRDLPASTVRGFAISKYPGSSNIVVFGLDKHVIEAAMAAAQKAEENNKPIGAVYLAKDPIIQNGVEVGEKVGALVFRNTGEVSNRLLMNEAEIASVIDDSYRTASLETDQEMELANAAPQQ